MTRVIVVAVILRPASPATAVPPHTLRDGVAVEGPRVDNAGGLAGVRLLATAPPSSPALVAAPRPTAVPGGRPTVTPTRPPRPPHAALAAVVSRQGLGANSYFDWERQ